MAKDLTAGFTRFVGPKREAALRALARFAGTDEGAVEFAPRRPDDASWRAVAHVRTPDGELRLDLAPATPGRRAWFEVGPIAVGYRKGSDGTDPFHVPALAGRLERLRGELAARTPEAEAADAATREYVPFDGVRDEFYRQITVGHDGVREAHAAGFLRLGFRCNQDCHFCWQDRSWPDAPPELYRTWIHELIDQGVDTLTITGGEPTLNRDLPELVRVAARDHGLRVLIETNAIRFARPDFAAAMRDAGVEGLFVSYHSADAEISDEMTRARGTHTRTEAGIAGALDVGIKVKLNCVVELRNHDRLGEHAETIVARFVTPFNDNPVHSVTYSMAMDYFDHALWQQRAVSLDAVEPHLVRAVRTLRDAGVEVQALGTCGFPPCTLRNAPDAIWWLDTSMVDQQDADGRDYAPVCDRCSRRSQCLGPRREYVAQFGDRGLVPFA